MTRTELGFAVTRAHHADVGGSEPGSLPPASRTLDEEGVVIPPTRLDDATLESLVSRMRNPDERRGDLRAQLAAHRLAEARVVGPLRSARTRARRRGDGRAPRVLRARRACSHSRAPGRPLRGRRPPRDTRRTARHPRGGHRRRRRDRDRLRRNRPAVRRKPQLPTRRHALGLLLRRALPDGAGPPRLGRRLHSGLGARAGGLARQRTVARSGRGREHGDVEPHHRRRVRRVLEGDSRAGAGAGDDEQRRRRQRPLRLLRDGRRRSGRLSRRGRAVGRPRRDVEHVQHAGGGARARVPAPRRAVRAAHGLRRRGASPRRRRHRARAAHPRGLPALPPHAAARGRAARRARRRRRPAGQDAAERGGAPRDRGARPRPGDLLRVETPGGGGWGSPG